MEMIETLVRGSNTPISEALMALFPMIANLTILTDDSAIMQVCCVCFGLSLLIWDCLFLGIS